MDFLQLVAKIKDEIPDLYANDINYDIKIKTKIIKREERIIYFGHKKYLVNLESANTIEFFINITFKIIPKKFHPYKLFVLSDIPK